MSDQTRQFSPFDDDGDDDDRTRVRPGHPDETTVNPSASADATRVNAPASADETRVNSSASVDATRVGEPVKDDGAWAGRATVRPPRPTREDWTSADDWATSSPREPRGKWWLPIVVGIVGLVLLGALGWGVYLIATNSDEPSDSPAVPQISAPGVQTPRTTTTTTTNQPTTTPPTTEPTTTEPTGPTEITVPALLGLSQQEAQEALTRRGLKFRSIVRPSENPAGTVIDSDPAEGQEVPPDTVVTLVIAAPQQAPPSIGGTRGQN
ncbi:PASTA domain-containing protein [Actinoplanes sp. NPDC089786]|uniref:PASTA domain-containing protein n=1 Tax=Actinoplanes sp. NPDC089786 TaxID=3155185 RepID=UPI00342BD8E5